MPTTQNLGVVRAIHIGTSAPTNTQMLWYDTTVNQHKYYDVVTGVWTPLISGGAPVTSVNGYIGVVVLDADDISDAGTANKWYSTTLFDADFALKTTDDLAEGVANLYFTQARFDTSFAAKTTDDLSEGLTNLYFTNARARLALTGVSPILYNTVSGEINIQQAGPAQDGYLSAADWNMFNGAASPPSGTLNKVAKFTPSGSQLGDSQISDNGTNLALSGVISPTIGVSWSATSAVLDAGMHLQLSTTVDDSVALRVLNGSITSNVNGQKTITKGAGTRAYVYHAEGDGNPVLPIAPYSQDEYIGYLANIKSEVVAPIGFRAVVESDAALTAYGAHITVSGTNKYMLRLEDGVDNTGKFLKITDSLGHVEALDFSGVTYLTDTPFYVTKWTASGGEITDSQIQDDGANLAIGPTTIDPNSLLKVQSNDIVGVTIAHNPPSTSETTSLHIIADGLNAATNNRAGIRTEVENSNINIGHYVVVSNGNAQTYDPGVYDLLTYASIDYSIGGMFSVLSTDRSNYAMRLRADNDNTATNFGLHIRTRNAVGNQIPVVIDSGSQQAGYVLTSDASGNADWAPVTTGAGDVLVGSSETNDFLTKWDPMAPSTITDSLIEDSGSAIGIGIAPDAAKYFQIAATTQDTGFSVTQSKTTGNPTALYAEANGAVVGQNTAGHFKAINGGTNVPIRLEDGVDNSGKFLKVLNSDGDVGFAVGGTGTVTDQAGGQTLNFLTRWTAADEIGNSSIEQHAAMDTFAIGAAPSNSIQFVMVNTDNTIQKVIDARLNGSYTIDAIAIRGYAEASNTGFNVGVHGHAEQSTDVNVGGMFTAAGSVQAPLTTDGHSQGINVLAQPPSVAKDATGALIVATGATTGTNIGVKILATNSGAGANYGMQIVDGSEGAGKVLTSDANGNASWTAPTPSNNIYTADGSLTGNRQVDMNGFLLGFVDSTGTEPKVGIGTNNPTGTLELAAPTINNNLTFELSEGGSTKWYIETDFATANEPVHFKNNAGNHLQTFKSTTRRIGMGTSEPKTHLHVAGPSSIGSYLNENTIELSNTSIGIDPKASFRFSHTSFDIVGANIIGGREQDFAVGNRNGYLAFQTGKDDGTGTVNLTTAMHISSEQCVGIGTTTPTHLLEVDKTSSSLGGNDVPVEVNWQITGSPTGNRGAVTVNVESTANGTAHNFQALNGGGSSDTGQLSGMQVNFDGAGLQTGVNAILSGVSGATGLSGRTGFFAQLYGSKPVASGTEANTGFRAIVNTTGTGGTNKGIWLTAVTGNTNNYDMVLEGDSCIIGSTSPAPSAILELDSTSKALLITRMIGSAIESIASPENGMLVYCTLGNGVTVTAVGFWGYENGAWSALGGSGGAVPNLQAVCSAGSSASVAGTILLQSQLSTKIAGISGGIGSEITAGNALASMSYTQATTNSISLDGTGVEITDTISSTGAKYAANYRVNFTGLSLVDKSWVEGDSGSGNGFVGSSYITELGTVTTGTWNATTIALGYGGTGQTSADSVVAGSTKISVSPNQGVFNSGIDISLDVNEANLDVANMQDSGKSFQTLTQTAGTFTWDYSLGYNAQLDLVAGANTLAITNSSDGDYGTLKLDDSVGTVTSFTLPANSFVVNNGSGSVTSTITPNGVDVLSWVKCGDYFYWTYGLNYT